MENHSLHLAKDFYTVSSLFSWQEYVFSQGHQVSTQTTEYIRLTIQKFQKLLKSDKRKIKKKCALVHFCLKRYSGTFRRFSTESLFLNYPGPLHYRKCYTYRQFLTYYMKTLSCFPEIPMKKAMSLLTEFIF